MKIGIVGLPNVGKSTLFKALTKQQVDISNYPFCTINPNVGVVVVPDERLEKIKELVKPEKIVPAVVEFVDIAGLVKGAHEGQGLGNQFLSHIYGVDAIAVILRCFEDPEIVHIEKTIDPNRDLEIIKNELLKKDEEILKRMEKNADKTEIPALSKKPMIYICNIKSGAKNIDPVRSKTSEMSADLLEANRTSNGVEPSICHLKIDFKLELEESEMNEEDLEELGLKPTLGELVKLAYKTLDLITFYTIKGGKELRAVPVKRGTAVPQSGGKVHSDFEEKFIRAEVVNFEKFKEAGSWQKSREKGWLRTEGKEYIVQDGDIIEFKI
jgi:ribosome-binding ATPase YchF (GTP1/OBG family)